jgi:hypothetical protein
MIYIGSYAGASGSDLGIWVGSSWAMVAYPGLRWLELKKFNRWLLEIAELFRYLKVDRVECS